MSIKLIAVDMDGTFLSDAKTYNRQRFLSQYRRMREQDIRFVVVSRGKRRQARRYGDDSRSVEVDANILTRQGVLKAVAIAAGRVSEEAERVSEEAERVSEEAGQAAALIPPSRAEALRRGQLILVAEDNETNRNVIAHQLALLGFAADLAEDGGEALQRWQSDDYALLLTDLNMPNMDGYELVDAIRTREKDRGARRIPVVALTANVLESEQQRCFATGMDGYLSKPVLLVNLQAMLNKWLPPLPTLVPVDVSVLVALVGDDPATIHEFLLDFRASAATIGAELSAACATGQAARAGALAHKLKSSARSVGALALGELCAEMESAGNDGQIAALSRVWPRFEAEMAAVDAALADLTAHE